MSTNLRNIVSDVSLSNLNLIVDFEVIGGSVSGSWWTITGPGNSISDWWDNCTCKEETNMG